MEEEGSINFKALRAKFQEEALMAEFTPSRPAVAGKPKHLPPPPPPPLLPPGGHCSFVVSSINMAVEKRTPVVPRVIFKDGLQGSGGKRPISFPPHPQRSPSSQLANGDGTARQSLKDRHMPLVLPALPVKEHKAEKKGLLLPFKSSKATKVNTENVEEPSYADLTRRFSIAPGELFSMEKQSTEDGYLLQSDQSTSDCLHSSPDFAITPPSAETSTDSENRIISTLERAKKKFSRQLLSSSKPKSLNSSDRLPRGKALASPPKSTESVESDPPIPPPVCLPHLACISARPFFKVNSSEPQSPNTADYKEQKKREKQRLEKEKKEQKEREKKENEMKKKFKVTGEEDPMYHAKVMVASKVRKNDLPVKHGDTVSIIRTTNCPKGKWLARDANHKYGYISVMNVELNIKEMLELGKKAQATGKGCNTEADTISIGSRY
uniref:Helically-extended SH3 domain-containing protein n=1 Tax=Sphaeramia orbicularis TaxID=375764 RepID=A0A672YQD8_9TELE